MMIGIKEIGILFDDIDNLLHTHIPLSSAEDQINFCLNYYYGC